MDDKKVTITYLDENDIWPNIVEDFRSHLPLRNLQFKPTNRPLRTIQSLDIKLNKFIADKPKEQPHMIPATLLEDPCLNMYLVNCDDNDTYRHQVKQQIKNWTSAVERGCQDWLIVYVSNQDRSTSRYVPFKGTVYDKIRSDFNTVAKKDRVVQLRLFDNDVGGFEVWQDLLSKIKEGILNSFDQLVLSYEEDVRRVDSQRTTPGWNYCTFFTMKERLAQSFEIMSLYEDALLVYDELEASFFQVLKDKALAWFGHFGGTDPGDDSANLLDIKKKDYRDLIMKNTISVFDFRSYLFARQCQLLGRLQRPVEICQRAQLFVSTFARTIRENEKSLVDHFLESWIYSSCMSVVNECEELAPLAGFDHVTYLAFNAAKAELLDLARTQLVKLGIWYNHLPNALPFSTALSDATFPEALPEGNDLPITNRELKEAITSAESFDLLYLTQTNRAMKGYDSSKRTNSSLRLQGGIASLKFHRKRYAEVIQIMESMQWQYGEEGWSAIENCLLTKFAACQKELGQHRKVLSESEAIFYSEELMAQSSGLEKDIIRPFAPIFVAERIFVLDDPSGEDGTWVEFTLSNSLPKAFLVDEISVRLVSGDDELWFAIEKEELPSGSKKFKLSTQTSVSGAYVVESARIKIGRIIFTHIFKNESTTPSIFSDSKNQIFQINEQSTALTAAILVPNEIHIGERQTLQVKVFTRRSYMSQGWLTINAISEGLFFPPQSQHLAAIRTDNTSSDPVREENLTMTEDGKITLPSCKPHEIIELQVPYETAWETVEHKVKITVEYVMNGKRHVYAMVDTLKIFNPLLVNGTNIFRENSLFLKLDVTCQGSLPIRLISTSLRAPKHYDVTDCSTATPLAAMTIFPRQNASIIYKLTRAAYANEEDITPNSKVQFFITYRTIGDEIEYFLTRALKNSLQDRKLAQHSTFILPNLKDQLRRVDYIAYGMTDVLELGEFDVEFYENLLVHHRDAKAPLMEAMKEFWEAHSRVEREQICEDSEQVQSVISFPIEIPTFKVLNTVELVLRKPKELVVGEPCHCQLRVRQSSYWSFADASSKEDEEAAPLEFFYDVNVDYDNWLLSGRKKLYFSSKMGETKEFPVTLVPLKTGQLLVPSVRVWSLSSETVFAETVYINSAQQVLVQPRARSATFFVEQQHRIHPINPGWMEN